MDLLITHCDLDGISPIILLNLTGRKFIYKSIEIVDIDKVFDELFETDLSVYEHIYITDLTLSEHAYDLIESNNLTNVLVFDHHESHLFAENKSYTTIKTHLGDVQTCGTELFYNYLKGIYEYLDNDKISFYVKQVRELDTYHFTSELPREIDMLVNTYGKTDFIKKMTRRLKSKKETFELSAFEKRFIKIKAEEKERYMQKKEKQMLTYEINNLKCGVCFAESNKSDLGNYLSNKYPELDLIVMIDASSRISYRTSRDDVNVNEFAALFGGGGHPKASGSKFDDTDRESVINNYFKNIKKIDIIKDENV